MLRLDSVVQRSHRATARNAAGRYLAIPGFFVLSLTVFGGTTPFPTLGLGSAPVSGGSWVEATLFLASAGASIAGSAIHNQRLAARSVPLSIAAALLYASFSLLWSDAAGIALLRFLQLVLVTVSVFAIVAAFGIREATRAVAVALGCVIVADLVSVALVPDAIHSPSNSHESLSGSWRGIHLHKNYAGAVAAIASIIFFIQRKTSGSAAWAWLLACSLALLIGSQSKTSIFLLALAAPCSAFYVYIVARSRASIVLPIAIIVLVLTFSIVSLLPLGDLLSDGTQLTGRVGLWEVLLPYLSENWFTGSGFGSFWRLGSESPILGLAEGWMIRTGQGHNGYLDTALTLGIPGLLAVTWAFLFSPTIALLTLRPPIDAYVTAGVALFVFSAFHNSLESSILVGNHPVYFAMILAVAIVLKAHISAST